ncbi:MAG: mechanosensitive ion channel [Campylobacterota bacterium]|nr:mechanosensitive ion channel [Campylobacterota bacterium]
MHFVVTLILPSMELSEIPEFITNNFDKEVVFVVISIKLFVLISLFSLLSMAIRHFMEHYVVIYDQTKLNGLSIPPEFAKFFSYLTLIVFSIILLYGTLFINYPNLEREYKSCMEYTERNHNTYSNCQKFMNDNNVSLINGKFIYQDYKELPKKIENTIKYCNNVLNNHDKKIELSNCSIGMSIEQNKERSMNNAMISSPSRSLSDYLPLSIFLTLFGVVMMIATKNLLENYFTGLSLKIDIPYEEGERIRIDGGEMLTVEHIGFRATTFYGISSHANLVIPHQTLTNSVITNFTKPTLDYREKITIHIPDRKHDTNIPRMAEKVMLLAAFIATGVKKPRLNIQSFTDSESELEQKIIAYKEQTKHYSKILSNHKTRKEVTNRLNDIEACLQSYFTDIIDNLIALDDKVEDIHNNDKISKKLFLNRIIEVAEDDKDNKQVIRKIVASIIAVIYDYEDKIDDLFAYQYDEYLIKRKKDLLVNKDNDKLEEIADLLVNINYYYFALAKQLWQIKEDSNSTREKNKIDQASLDLLDVPRVSSQHRRDIEEEAFWEVSLMVTVELAEQSDEIAQHINMFIDELWDIFELPSICHDKNSDN